MASSSGSGGAIVASVLITLIIVGAGAYFGLPYLYPNINKSPAGLVKQDISVESQTQAFIDTNTNSVENISNMVMNLTISNESIIEASFSSSINLYIESGLVGTVNYSISLVISGVGSVSKTIGYFSELATTSGQEWFESLSIDFTTTPLPAGTYIISVTWSNVSNLIAGYSQLFTDIPAMNSPRVLQAMEITT